MALASRQHLVDPVHLGHLQVAVVEGCSVAVAQATVLAHHRQEAEVFLEEAGIPVAHLAVEDRHLDQTLEVHSEVIADLVAAPLELLGPQRLQEALIEVEQGLDSDRLETHSEEHLEVRLAEQPVVHLVELLAVRLEEQPLAHFEVCCRRCFWCGESCWRIWNT